MILAAVEVVRMGKTRTEHCRILKKSTEIFR
jgi:hypothetical protein